MQKKQNTKRKRQNTKRTRKNKTLKKIKAGYVQDVSNNPKDPMCQDIEHSIGLFVFLHEEKCHVIRV